MRIGIHTATVQKEFEMKGPLQLLCDHVESCIDCCWVTRTFCRTALLLEMVGMQQAAALAAPIPTIPPIPRSKSKA